MNIRAELLQEHSKAITIKIADYVGVNKKRFEQLIKTYLSGPYRITQRAAWPLGICVERHPELITPHLKEILAFAGKPGVHNAVKRNTVRLLQFIDVPKRYRGRVLDISFEFLQSKKEPVAVKVFSMSVIAKLAAGEPDLKKELRIIVEDQLPYSSPAFTSRAKKVLKEIDLIKTDTKTFYSFTKR